MICTGYEEQSVQGKQPLRRGALASSAVDPDLRLEDPGTDFIDLTRLFLAISTIDSTESLPISVPCSSHVIAVDSLTSAHAAD
jgi:hypothetical protein